MIFIIIIIIIIIIFIIISIIIIVIISIIIIINIIIIIIFIIIVFVIFIIDNLLAGVVEPAISKIKSLRFATEAAISILRIDDLIKLNAERQQQR